ncbi:LANO_0C00386g1_1 [Lachancea nothofagi CBS 11611]|uniref:LANO_0C00386g1_1 n=1 Tax=Lachancea nothofagi CBS 11611 TaxID=1266666 RepID=A0A1G4J302_9SACH|nr:LANO_0C00386g1_1 [Lachancea nothofagi CBS 11611]
MTDSTETSTHVQRGYVAEDVDDKTIAVEEKLVKEPLNEYGMPDKLRVTKSLVIRKAELMAKQYDTSLLKAQFLLATFICAFGYGLDTNIRSVYMVYAMDSYQFHSLTSTIGVVGLVIAAVAQIFYAGLSDVFGRLSLFLLSIVLYVVGTIIQSQAYDVQRYAAGSVFYNVGIVGVMLQVVLILSDNSSLKWRLFYTLVPAWPPIITMWASGSVVAAADPQNNWSWGIAMWAFIFPLTCVPLICCMLHMRWKVRNDPEWKELQTEKTFYQTHGLVQTLVQLFWKLDIVGLLLFTASIGCILVPLTLAGGYSSQWRNAKIIAPFVVGFVLALAFIYWESKLALLPFAPFKLLKDRGIWAPLWIMFLICFIYQMAAGFLYTILLVAVDETVLSATRILSLYSFVSAVAAPFLGILVARSARLKPYIIAGCSLYYVTMGLFYHYRGGQDSDRGIIGAMVVWGIASCMFNYPMTVSIQSVTSHENMATVTALTYTMFRIGGAVASAISGAIWTQSLYPKLLQYMGDSELAQAAYSSPLTFYLKYPWGTPVRDAMVMAYRHVQKYEVLVALILTGPMLLLTFCLRDPELTDDVAQELNEGEYVKKNQDDPIGDWAASRFSKLTRRR